MGLRRNVVYSWERRLGSLPLVVRCYGSDLQNLADGFCSRVKLKVRFA